MGENGCTEGKERRGQGEACGHPHLTPSLTAFLAAIFHMQYFPCRHVFICDIIPLIMLRERSGNFEDPSKMRSCTMQFSLVTKDNMA